MGASGTIRRVLAVAALTFREAWRRKIVVAAVAMSAAFLVLYGLGLHFAATSPGSTDATAPQALLRAAAAAQMLSVGLFPASFILAFTAVFASAGTIAGELETGVLYGVLARPVRRWELVVGKFVGLATMLAAYALVLVSAVVGLAAWQIGTHVNAVPASLALFVLEPIILLALAVLGSTRLPTLANGVLVTAAYGIGFVGGLIEQIGALIGSNTMSQIGIVSSLLMPFDAVHRKAVALLVPGGSQLAGGGPSILATGTISAVPSAWMVAWAVGYVLCAVLFAARVFSRRDL